MADLFPIAQPFLKLMPPETAHRATIFALKKGLLPRPKPVGDPRLAMEIAGLRFPNPVGLAAGFDKNAEVPDAMLAQGFGFVEAGTVTPQPQPGNPKPRVFRLAEDQAVINRLGFNNEGLDAAVRRLERRRGRPGIVGINLGANKDTEDKAADYVEGLKRTYGLGSYFTINISSPNTPGLRGLQARGLLDDLIGRLMAAREECIAEGQAKMPLFLKIAPDLDEAQKEDIAAVVLGHEVDALIVSNTTIGGRDRLKSPHAQEAGGLSGAPLFDLSTEILGEMRVLTQGKVPLIGVGGVGSGEQAYAKIRRGASLVQLYTALTYQGTGLVTRINEDLIACLDRDGHARLADAVGSDVPL